MIQNETLLIAAIFLGIDTAALIILLILKLKERSRRRKIRHFGDKAEEMVASYINENITPNYLFNHILLRIGSGATEIDHLLICRWGIFVIETKSHNGKIVTGKKEWIQYYGDKVIKFHSPILQNDTHIKAVENILKRKKSLAKIKVKGLIVFTSNKVYFSEKKSGVIKLDRLNFAIKYGGASKRYSAVTSHPKRCYLSKEKMKEIARIISENIDKSGKHKRMHEKALDSYNDFFNDNPLR